MSNPEYANNIENGYGPFEVIKCKVGEADVSILGIDWGEGDTTLASFAPREELFRGLIAELGADGVVLEFSPDRTKYQDQNPLSLDSIKNFSETLRGVNIEPYNWGMCQGLRGLLAEYHKPVFTVDPMCNAFYGISVAEQIAILYAFGGVATDMISTSIIGKFDPKITMTRRNFLRWGLEVVGVIGVSKLLTIDTLLASASTSYLENRTNFFIRQFNIGPENFRHVISAQGIELISSMIDTKPVRPGVDPLRILCICGWTHTRPLEYYLKEENRDEREARIKIYQDNLGKWFECAATEYAFDEGQWQERNRLPINQG